MSTLWLFCPTNGSFRPQKLTMKRRMYTSKELELDFYKKKRIEIINELEFLVDKWEIPKEEIPYFRQAIQEEFQGIVQWILARAY